MGEPSIEFSRFSSTAPHMLEAWGKAMGDAGYEAAPGIAAAIKLCRQLPTDPYERAAALALASAHLEPSRQIAATEALTEYERFVSGTVRRFDPDCAVKLDAALSEYSALKEREMALVTDPEIDFPGDVAETFIYLCRLRTDIGDGISPSVFTVIDRYLQVWYGHCRSRQSL